MKASEVIQMIQAMIDSKGDKRLLDEDWQSIDGITQGVEDNEDVFVLG